MIKACIDMFPRSKKSCFSCFRLWPYNYTKGLYRASPEPLC